MQGLVVVECGAGQGLAWPARTRAVGWARFPCRRLRGKGPPSGIGVTPLCAISTDCLSFYLNCIETFSGEKAAEVWPAEKPPIAGFRCRRG